MTMARTVAVALVASILIAALPKTTWAGEEGAAPAPVDLRAAIDRAAARSVSNTASTSPISQPAARARQNPGGGGGSSAMIWTLVGTVTSLAATYFIVKEMKKETDQLTGQPQ